MSLRGQKSGNAPGAGKGVKSEEKKSNTPPPPVLPPRAGQKGFTNFCPHLSKTSTTPQDVVELLATKEVQKRGYVQCAGTTTLFGQKDCVNRQCYCITKNAAETFPPSPAVFSTAEMETLVNAGLTTTPYQMCNRHATTLRIPFAYLHALELKQTELADAIEGDILFTRDRATETDDSELVQLMDLMDKLLRHIKERTGRQEASNARASIKRAFDHFTSDDDVNRSTKRKRLTTTMETMFDIIADGRQDDIKKE